MIGVLSPANKMINVIVFYVQSFQANGDTSRDLRLDSDDIADPVNDRLTLAERNERLQGQLRSLKDELAVTR